ncbi:MAG: hypothetical protein EOM87_02555 [Clostridia bacterium]|nr:hypothetical protein [Clostridia bacterium]
MIKNLFECNKENKVALALGYFDAIHLGHQSIFNTVIAIDSAIPSVFTFSNNIYKLLGREVKEIYSFEERCKLIESYGIKNIFYIDATIEILAMSGREFLDMLLKHLDITFIASGADYTYGVFAENDTEDLKKYCKDFDIDCSVKPLIMENEQKQIYDFVIQAKNKNINWSKE